jgi:Ferritin-like domain
MSAHDPKSLRTAPLATPTDLKSNAVKDISGALNILLADMFTLYLKTKNFHWHVSGPHFRDYHLMLDEQGEQIFATTDILRSGFARSAAPRSALSGIIGRGSRVREFRSRGSVRGAVGNDRPYREQTQSARKRSHDRNTLKADTILPPACVAHVRYPCNRGVRPCQTMEIAHRPTTAAATASSATATGPTGPATAPANGPVTRRLPSGRA